MRAYCSLKVGSSLQWMPAQLLHGEVQFELPGNCATASFASLSWPTQAFGGAEVDIRVQAGRLPLAIDLPHHSIACSHCARCVCKVANEELPRGHARIARAQPKRLFQPQRETRPRCGLETCSVKLSSSHARDVLLGSSASARGCSLRYCRFPLPFGEEYLRLRHVGLVASSGLEGQGRVGEFLRPRGIGCRILAPQTAHRDRSKQTTDSPIAATRLSGRRASNARMLSSMTSLLIATCCSPVVFALSAARIARSARVRDLFWPLTH